MRELILKELEMREQPEEKKKDYKISVFKTIKENKRRTRNFNKREGL